MIKKLLSIIFVSLLWCTISSAAFLTEKQIIYKDIEECTKDGYWICEQSKIDKLVNKYIKEGGAIMDCENASYEAPCICNKFENSNFAKKKYCKFKMKPKKIKKKRMEAADHCSNLSNRKNKEVRNEYYKSCMQDQGYR